MPRKYALSISYLIIIIPLTVNEYLPRAQNAIVVWRADQIIRGLGTYLYIIEFLYSYRHGVMSIQNVSQWMI